jgi:hypothetical protein
VLTQHPEDPVARLFFVSLVQQITSAWTNVEELRGSRESFFDPDRIHGLTESVASFLLQLPLETSLALFEPVLAAIPRHPKEVADIVDWLITVEDEHPRGEVFWTIWQAVADRFLASDLVESVDVDHSGAPELLRSLFFNTNWKDGAIDWGPLHGNQLRVERFFDTLPPSGAALSAYTCFLYKIGASTLPLPLVAIAAKINGQDQNSVLSETVVFYLETILNRLIQGRPTNMLAREDVRQSILFLLDKLVEQGSSTGYKLRDDFVTPHNQ